MPFNRQMDKEDVVHIYNGILLSPQKEQLPNIAAIWTGLEEIILSEISQAEKDNYQMVSLICGINRIAERSVGEVKNEGGVNRRGNEPRETMAAGKQTEDFRGEGGIG